MLIIQKLQIVFDQFPNAVLTPDVLSAWASLSGSSQIRIIICSACCILVGATLMTAGARFLLNAALLVVVTPKVAEIAHQISGLDEPSVRSGLYLIALLVGGLGAVLATLTVIQRSLLIAIAALVAFLLSSMPLTIAGSLSDGLTSLWTWIIFMFSFLNGQ